MSAAVALLLAAPLALAGGGLAVGASALQAGLDAALDAGSIEGSGGACYAGGVLLRADGSGGTTGGPAPAPWTGVVDRCHPDGLTGGDAMTERLPALRRTATCGACLGRIEGGRPVVVGAEFVCASCARWMIGGPR